MVKANWTAYYRSEDGELLGWIASEDDGFTPIDRLGRSLSDTVDRRKAEAALEDVGLRYLADAYELQLEDGQWLRVLLTEVSTTAIKVKVEDWGAPPTEHTLPFPLPANVRPR